VVLGIEGVFDVGPNRLRVEGRAVVKDYILPQMKGVGAAVRGYLPAFGQPRHELAGIRVEEDERVVDRRERDPELGRGVQVRIDSRRGQRKPIAEGGGLGLRRRARGR
jgi:hypothetical protein